MNELQCYCDKQLADMEKLILEAERQLQYVPEGTLRVSHFKNFTRYYWKHNGSQTQGDYIKKKDVTLAQQLAQKEYLEKVLLLALRKKKQMQTLSVKYDSHDILKFHEKFSLARQELITPLILSDEENAQEWMREKKEELKKFHMNRVSSPYPLDDDMGIETERGELVRSKSEKIIADKLFKMNIPYIYEMPLLLPGYGYVYPDFTVFNKRERRQIYWEHFGMMDKEDYSEQAVKKIRKYEKNEIYIGRKLITTYETSTQVLNTKVLEKMIKEFFL